MWVRTASARDIEQISLLLNQVWHHTYDLIYGPQKIDEITQKWHASDQLRLKLAAHDSEFLVADDGTKIAGVASASITKLNQVKLHQLYILPEFQGRGVGRLLLEEIEGSFIDAREIFLEVEEKNTAAIRFYQKHGFREGGNTTECGEKGSGIPALIFTKSRF